MRKKIAMYFGKEKSDSDPFSDFGIKKSVYHYFFKLGTECGFDMYIASGKESYLGDLKFKNLLFYNGACFEKENIAMKMNAIFDRSGSMIFPPKNLDRKVLNCSAFKILCNDKNAMHKLLACFMPKSFSIKNQSEFLEKLSKFKKNNLVVLKPAKGLGGKGIIIDLPEKIKEITLKDKTDYVLQEFIDTSKGIKGIVRGNHDLRVVIVDGKITLSHIRTPKKGSLLANVAQGGAIKELAVLKIPSRVLSVTKKIQKIIDKKFFYPLYSIDFGINSNGKPFVFELNDQIGFPSEKMRGHKPFIQKIIMALRKITDNK